MFWAGERCLFWTVFLSLVGAITGRSSDALNVRLERAVHEVIDRSKYAPAQWGVSAVEMRTGTQIVSIHGDKVLSPASNTKLFSAALALEFLGPEYRIRTTVLTNGAIDDSGALDGDLRIVGRGDPSFAARFYGWNYSRSMERLVDLVRESGVRKIEGSLLGDVAYYKGRPYGAGWAWEDLEEYFGAPVSALNVDDNVVDLVIRPSAKLGAPCEISARPSLSGLEFVNRTTTSNGGGARIRVHRDIGSPRVVVTGSLKPGDSRVYDSVSVSDPATWSLRRFRQDLQDAGIPVSGTSAIGSDAMFRTSDWTLVGETESAPLSEIVRYTLKRSQNLYAQTLFLQVGASHPSVDSFESTEFAARARLEAFLGGMGIGSRDAYIEEGSGLSRRNRVSANAVVQFLRALKDRPYFANFLESLPVAGRDGTLAGRFQESAATDVIRAKTGRLQGVVSLAGYVYHDNQVKGAFSVMVNQFLGTSYPSARNDLDHVATLIAQAVLESWR